MMKEPASTLVAPKLSHFMNLDERTDLICMTPTADPLGPDSFDQFHLDTFKEEMPDSIEIDNITFNDLPFKMSQEADENVTHASTIELLAPHRTPDNEFTTDNLGKNDEADNLNQQTNKIVLSEVTHCQRSTSRIRRVKKKGKILQMCDVCEKQFSSIKTLRLHKLKKHGEKVQFKCVFCDFQFDLLRRLLQHVKSEHSNHDFFCGVCNRKCSDYKCFLTHIKSNIKNYCREEEIDLNNSYQCNNEDQADKDKSLATLKKLGHKPDKRKRTKLKRQEKNFICDLCGKRFAFHCLLRDHMNLHTGMKPHLCSECGKAFSLKSTLKQHSKTHAEVRPFQCSECPSGFYAKGDLKKHSRKHTGERPYVCEVCSEGFSRSSHLRVHRRLHSGERPFECNECGRAFTKRGDLVRHRRVHSGELPYLCQVCGKAFRQSTQCANHIKSHHPETNVPVVVSKPALQLDKS